jgi:para-nitrobenzyl esterase
VGDLVGHHVRDALALGPSTPQPKRAAEVPWWDWITGRQPQSEDCLVLNVFAPTSAIGRKLPVMFWIHGGGYSGGASSEPRHNGDFLPLKGVVLVTINYRLGAFGFLNLHDASGGKFPGTGAEGLADQIAALTWVQRNIAAFGGDPGNVTIFGESAGGMSVGALLAAPSARGLFHKAIAQSGASDIGYARDTSAKVAHHVLEGEVRLAGIGRPQEGCDRGRHGSRMRRPARRIKSLTDS